MTDTIQIIQGDDTNYEGDSILVLNISTEKDLTGYIGRFQIGTVIKDYPDITNKSINIVLTKEETLILPEGTIYGAFKLYDADGRAKTIVSDIIFNVAKQKVRND